MEIEDLHGIADRGATSVFIKEGVPVDNKQPATNSLTVNLPNGRQVKSTHTCDVIVPGLPRPILGHIVPNLTIASLFGIFPLCNAGCIVVFDQDKYTMLYDGKSYFNQSTKSVDRFVDIAISVKQNMQHYDKTTGSATTQHFGPSSHGIIYAFGNDMHKCGPICLSIVGQSLYFHVTQGSMAGLLNECPNISEKLVLKYLNPSPATMKGHMKRPRHGIQSTTPKIAITPVQVIAKAPVQVIDAALIQLFHPPLSVGFNNAGDDGNVQPAAVQPTGPSIIFDKDTDKSIANIFAFGAFANKNSGIMYSNLTGSFPFMLLDGSVCFFVLYYYKSNSILADLIKGLDDKTIFEAYKIQFNELTKQGFKPKLNVIDNQATKYIKQFHDKNKCKLQLVEPHNHHVDATEHAIQTFKDAFIAAFATMDSNLPIQLWGRLTPQVQNTLNMMCALRVNPAILAYKAFNGP